MCGMQRIVQPARLGDRSQSVSCHPRVKWLFVAPSKRGHSVAAWCRETKQHAAARQILLDHMMEFIDPFTSRPKLQARRAVSCHPVSC